jgi:predicted negative regulator of RcsB-dependent stress response
MEYQTYSDRINEGSRLLDAGDLAGAAAIFEALASSEISDLDKALMAHNAAVVCERMQQQDAAIGWYDYGIAYEAPYFRFMLNEKKAEYLARLGRKDEAIAIYEDLLQQPYLMEHDKERVWNAISVLKRPRT